MLGKAPATPDWPAILADIHAAGVSYRQQAILLEVEYSTLQRWLQGTEPKYWMGNEILAMLLRTCGAEQHARRTGG